MLVFISNVENDFQMCVAKGQVNILYFVYLSINIGSEQKS